VDQQPVRHRTHGVVPDREAAEPRALAVLVHLLEQEREARAEVSGPEVVEPRALGGRREHRRHAQLDPLPLAVGERGALHVREHRRAQILDADALAGHQRRPGRCGCTSRS
jgi:hypothetical protein